MTPASGPPGWTRYAAVASTFCMIFGWNWDISWHRSIGRDTVWTLPHIAIYVSLAIAFAYNAFLVLRATYGAGRAEPGIRVLGFRGPSGAFITLWAVLLQFTSILFDNWWHGVYGLDSAVFSPPHFILAGAISAFYFGQFLLVATFRNRGEAGGAAASRFILLLIWSFFLGHLLIGMDPQFGPLAILSESFLVSCAVILPFSLVLIDETLESPWAAAICAAVYMIGIVLLMQAFQLFPATPRFGPVFHRITRFLPPSFPLLLVVPALLTSFTARRLARSPAAVRWLGAGAVFVVSFLLANALSAAVLVGPFGDNRFFAGANPGSAFAEGYRGIHLLTISPRGLVYAAVSSLIAASSCFIGAATGRWMRTVVR